MPLSNHYICSSGLVLPLSWASYFSFNTIHVFKYIICLFSLRNPKIVLTFPLCVLWLIISSYYLTLHLLSVSSSLHKHCHIFIRVICIYIFLLILFFSPFIFLVSKNNLRSFYSFDARSPLNFFICISEARLCVSPRA